MNFEVPSQFRQASSNTENRQYTKVSFVLSLLGHRGPSAVFFTIMAIIIFSIYGVTGWRASHVLQESIKRISPSFANSNASTAIANVRTGIRVNAPLLHGLPYMIEWIGGAAGMTPFSVVDAVNPLHATTRAFISVSEGHLPSYAVPTANAKTNIGALFFPVSRKLWITNPNYCQISEFRSTWNLTLFWHNDNNIKKRLINES